MGNFGGHALPGSFFIIFGLWYAIQAFRRYFICRQTGAKFKSSITFPCSCLCGRAKDWPTEAMIKVFFISVGFTLEIITGFSDGEFVYIGNGQHATMFFFFGLTGVVDIMVHYGAPLPHDVDYLSNALAFGVEGLLFNFHLYGRTSLDILVHTLMLYVILVTFVAVFLEMRYRHSLLSPLTRAFLVLQQGTWFWQVGFILYHPLGMEPWDEHDHEQLMVATLYFTWHAGANFLVILLIGAVIACRHRRRGGYYSNDVNMKRLINMTPEGHTMVAMNDDSGSDVEFQKPVMKP